MTDDLRSYQKRLEWVQRILSNNSEEARSELKIFLNEVSKFPAQGNSHSTLLDLNGKGLQDDIAQSPYVISDHCVEQDEGTGVETEKSASTLRGVRNAPICINPARIAEKTTSQNVQAQLVGLLMHEHVRHFGLEDKAGLLQPISIFVVDRFDYFGIYELYRAQKDPGYLDSVVNLFKKLGIGYYRPYYFNKQYVKDAVYVRGVDASDGAIVYKVYTTAPSSISVSIEEISGDCGRKPLGSFYTFSAHAPIRRGTVLPLTDGIHASGKSFYKFVQTSDFGIGAASADCRITFAVHTLYGKLILSDTASPLPDSGGIDIEIDPVDLTDEKPIQSRL